MEQLSVIIQDISQKAVELANSFVRYVLNLQDLFDSPWILITPLFMIGILGLVSFRR